MGTLSRWSLILVVVLAACGGDEDAADGTTDTDPPGTDTDTDTPGPTGDTVEVDISAAAGGTVEAFGAVLEIPPGSLAADTRITVSASAASGLPDAATVLGQVLDFGPDGTTFAVAATLTLPAVGTVDEEIVVSWLDGSSWVDLPTTAEGGVAIAEVAHFTSFAARALVVGTTPGGAGTCEPVAGCGGDLTGAWEVVATCRMSAGELPFLCDVPYTTTVTPPTELVTFAGDGGYQEGPTGAAGQGVTQLVAPAECIPAGIASCETLWDGVALESAYTCTGDVAVACECEGEPFAGGGGPGRSGGWAVAGTELTVTLPGEVGTIDLRYEYCVAGDTLTVWDDDEGRPTVYARVP